MDWAAVMEIDLGSERPGLAVLAWTHVQMSTVALGSVTVRCWSLIRTASPMGGEVRTCQVSEDAGHSAECSRGRRAYLRDGPE